MKLEDQFNLCDNNQEIHLTEEQRKIMFEPDYIKKHKLEENRYKEQSKSQKIQFIITTIIGSLTLILTFISLLLQLNE